MNVNYEFFIKNKEDIFILIKNLKQYLLRIIKLGVYNK